MNNVIYLDSNKDHLAQFNITGNNYEFTEDETLLGDSLFKSATNSHNSINPNRYINPKKYWFQYITYIDKHNEKWLLVSGFCQKYNSHKSLLQSSVIVFDGGDCYFLLTINISRISFSEISMNGNA